MRDHDCSVLGWLRVQKMAASGYAQQGRHVVDEHLAGDGKALRLCSPSSARPPPPHLSQVEMDDGSGFRHIARSAERQCTVHGLHSGILYK